MPWYVSAASLMPGEMQAKNLVLCIVGLRIKLLIEVPFATQLWTHDDFSTSPFAKKGTL